MELVKTSMLDEPLNFFCDIRVCINLNCISVNPESWLTQVSSAHLVAAVLQQGTKQPSGLFIITDLHITSTNTLTKGVD